jgi:hypothetical protein
MIGFDLLLIPDTGPQFARCLKTAALYAENIYCVSSIAPKLVRELSSDNSSRFGERTKQFLDASALHEKEFGLLRSEGILGSMDDPPDPAGPTEEERHELMLNLFRAALIRYEAARQLAGR